MMRNCGRCHRQLTRQEFVKEESKGMEADRKRAGLQGVRFLYYRCAECGCIDLFVDVHPLPGESDEAFHQRRAELEAAAREIHENQVEVVLTERGHA
jgi:hypothetical protein